jgi:hypothetical protein
VLINLALTADPETVPVISPHIIAFVPIFIFPNPETIDPLTNAPTLVSEDVTMVEPKVVPDRIVLLPIEYDCPLATVIDPPIEIDPNPLVIEPELSAPTVVSEDVTIVEPKVVPDKIVLLPIEYDCPLATVIDPPMEIDPKPLVIEPELSAPTLVNEEDTTEDSNVVADSTETVFIL